MEALTCIHLENGDSGEGIQDMYWIGKGLVLDPQGAGTVGCVGTHRMLQWHVWAQLMLEDGYHSSEVSYRTLVPPLTPSLASSKEQKDVSQQGWQGGRAWWGCHKWYAVPWITHQKQQSNSKITIVFLYFSLIHKTENIIFLSFKLITLMVHSFLGDNSQLGSGNGARLESGLSYSARKDQGAVLERKKISPLFFGKEEYSRRTFFNHYLSSVSSNRPWISPAHMKRSGLWQFLQVQCTIEMMPQNLCCGQGSSPCSKHTAQNVCTWLSATRILLRHEFESIIQDGSPIAS